jgi:4-hydroxythreonine-4-phosphate dehydrogenase
MKAPLAVSLGCPSGVGPEVAVVAAAASREPVLIVGDGDVVARAAVLRRIDPRRFFRVGAPAEMARLDPGSVGIYQPTPALTAGNVRYGEPSRAGGAAQLAWIDAACDLARRRDVRAVVTGPVSKDAIARSGVKGAASFIGHTEHIARRLRVREVIMAFWTAKLTTALVTTHIALRRVPKAITRAGVASATFWLTHLLHSLRRRGSRPPRVAVAALNPHAGEHGLFGDEEGRLIVPGMTLARNRLRRARLSVDLSGPVPAETVFRTAAERYDGIVALYHDQATIPMKILGFGEAVNVSLGLPIVRTSVDHGTAYDLAGRGIASPQGMISAMGLAAKMAGNG